MKAHVGVDVDSGIVHSLEATTAKVHDSRIFLGKGKGLSWGV